MNDITVEFPSGAFGKGGKVAVTPVKKGSVEAAQGRELSEFYQLVFPAEGVKEPFTISLNYDGDVNRVLFLTESPKRERYTGEIRLHPAVLSSSNKNGAVTATIPGIDATEGEQPFFTVGLIDGSDSAKPSTKANDVFSYTLDWCPPKKNAAKYEPYKDEILGIIRSEMQDIVQVYFDLGIEVSTSAVPYSVTQLSGGKWGQHNSDRFVKTSGTVEYNIDKFYDLVSKGKPYDKDLYAQLQQTIIHETFHWIHEVMYDPRCASKICITGYNEWSMLSEAMATWLEKFTGDHKISENCPGFADNLIFDFFCDNGESFEMTGYGMGLFIQWLSNRTSNKEIIKILDYQKANGGLLYSAKLRKAFDAFLTEHKLEFFKPWDNWSKFIWNVLDGKEDNRIDTKAYGLEYKMKLKHDSTPLRNAPVYNYGRTIQQIVLEPSLRSKLQENPGLCLAYTQKGDNLRTWICTSDYARKASVDKNKPYAMPGKDVLAANYHYVITERIEQDGSPKVINNDLLIEAVPWPEFVSFETGKFDSYYDWSGDEIKVTYTNNGYHVECDYPGGAHLKFNIGWVNNRFTDVANVYLHVEYDNSQDCQCGRLKLSSGEVSSVSKNLTWDGKYNGLWVSITCRLK